MEGIIGHSLVKVAGWRCRPVQDKGCWARGRYRPVPGEGCRLEGDVGQS